MALRRRIIQSAPHLATVQSGNTADSTIMAHFRSTMNKPANIIVTLPYNASGYSNIKVTACGINVLQCDTWTNGSNRGVSYAAIKNTDNEIEYITITGKCNGENGFRNLNYADNQFKWPPNGKYATYAYTTDADIVFVANVSYPTTVDGNYYWNEGDGKWLVYNLARDSRDSRNHVRIQLMPYSATANKTYNAVIKPMVCLSSDQGCEFEPYKGHSYSIIFPSTIYGGTIDLTNGVIHATYSSDGASISTYYSFTSQAISTLVGVNNIWSDKGSVIVKYWTN